MCCHAGREQNDADNGDANLWRIMADNVRLDQLDVKSRTISYINRFVLVDSPVENTSS